VCNRSPRKLEPLSLPCCIVPRLGFTLFVLLTRFTHRICQPSHTARQSHSISSFANCDALSSLCQSFANRGAERAPNEEVQPPGPPISAFPSPRFRRAVPVGCNGCWAARPRPQSNYRTLRTQVLCHGAQPACATRQPQRRANKLRRQHHQPSCPAPPNGRVQPLAKRSGASRLERGVGRTSLF
jgi:hypothetical protein